MITKTKIIDNYYLLIDNSRITADDFMEIEDYINNKIESLSEYTIKKINLIIK